MSLQLTGCWISLSVFLSVWCLYAAAAEIAFKRVVIDPQPPTNPWTKMVADFNGDGRPDIAIGGQSGPLVWYANPGWKRSIIAEGGYATVNGEAADVDGDGDADLVIGGRWYENAGDILKGKWTEHIFTGAWTHEDAKVEVRDLNGDGQLDVVVAQMHQGADPDEVMVFRNGGKGLTWTKQVLSTRGSHDIVVVDIDNDGDMDIVGANHGGAYPSVELLENLSRGRGTTASPHP